MTTFSSLPKLGVGLNYQPGLRAALGSLGDLIDFFEISPDLLCRERVRDGERALDYHPALLDEALQSTAGAHSSRMDSACQSARSPAGMKAICAYWMS